MNNKHTAAFRVFGAAECLKTAEKGCQVQKMSKKGPLAQNPFSRKLFLN